MNTKDYFYDLPLERIAQFPTEDRSGSRLLKLDKVTGAIEHGVFTDLPDLLGENDVLVMNNTRVLPARIYGSKEGTGAKIEFLLAKRIDLYRWEVMAKPAKRVKKGARVFFSEDLSCEVVEELDEGMRIVRFEFEGVFEEILHTLGTMPLPPYIKEKLEDQERYQTVYSKIVGSSAAPTAGLHFTQEMLDRLRQKGVQIEHVLLHVGLGTFKAVSAERLEDHKMHSEYYRIEPDTAARIDLAKKQGKRIICVGTTSVRTLESAAVDGKLKDLEGETEIFIYPPYHFQIADALITNFHLPESTLIMLVSAFSSREHILNAYDVAVREGYRFFSFGDAMFIG
ncbi:MAG: tRNA preQ1(34) S-adenosylmethionine ribosyltransferase-isomerase QueA [Peptostreptococcaceae bacterium]|nr:tRNA preQ1(34) S-adenosylmethionine ribosyltransferase-isomerase QueA [Peptostreptococcaceae bacterium]